MIVFNAVEDGMKNIENRRFEELDLLLQRVLTLVMVLIDTTRETPPEQKATQGKDWDDDEDVEDNDEEEMVMCRMMTTRILTMQKMSFPRYIQTWTSIRTCLDLYGPLDIFFESSTL